MFFDNNGQQFLHVEGLCIKQREGDNLLLSPTHYNTGDLLYGNLQHFYTSPPNMGYLLLYAAA